MNYNNMSQIRFYSLICGSGVLFLILVMILKNDNDKFLINENHFDLNRAIDKQSGVHFRVGFKYQNVHLLISGIKAYPKRILKKSHTEHLTKSEYLHERSFHRQDFAPVFLLNNDPDPSIAGSEAWNRLGSLQTITGLNHDVYAIDYPGIGQTKIKGRLKSYLSFYKALLDHWHWPRVILVANGKSIDHILKLAKEDLKEFELRVISVIFFVSNPEIVDHYPVFRLFTQTKLFVVHNEMDKSGLKTRLLDVVEELKKGIILGEVNDMTHLPKKIGYKLSPTVSPFTKPELIHEILTKAIEQIDHEF